MWSQEIWEEAEGSTEVYWYIEGIVFIKTRGCGCEDNFACNGACDNWIMEVWVESLRVNFPVLEMAKAKVWKVQRLIIDSFMFCCLIWYCGICLVL